MTRELQGTAAFKEEYVIEDFLAVRAGDGEIARLKASRKPAAVETDGMHYLEGRFRSLQDLETAFREFSLAPVRLAGGSDWVDLLIKSASFPVRFRGIRRQLREEEQAAADELGVEQLQKLRPFLEQASRLIDLHTRFADSMEDWVGRMLANPADRALEEAFDSEAKAISAELRATEERYLGEHRKAEDIKLKFVR